MQHCIELQHFVLSLELHYGLGSKIQDSGLHQQVSLEF